MSDLKSASYWVGHGLGIAATIIGIYLAAVVGFDTALKLELVKADRSTYYVTESLHKELTFNDKNMQAYIEAIKGKPYVLKQDLAGIKLNEFVFQAAKFSESTFEIDPALLTEVSIYYFSIGNAISQYYATGQKSPSSLMSVVKRETKALKEQKTLERLANYKQALRTMVKEQGITITDVNY